MNRRNQDPYRILGIPRYAIKKEIRRAYRHLVKIYHPDRNPDDPEAEEKFIQIQWAYENLEGRKGQGGISSMIQKKCFHTTSFANSTKPFYDFFSAMRAYCAKKKDIKGASFQQEKKIEEEGKGKNESEKGDA